MPVRFRLRNLIAEKELRDGDRVTYRDIATGAGVSTSTLVGMAKQDMKQVGIVTLEKLCCYFQCQPGDLMVYMKECSKND